MKGRGVATALLLALSWLPPAAAGERLTLPIDAEKSTLTFTISRPGETIEGTAGQFSGEIAFNPADLSQGGSVVLRIVAASLETGNRLRDHKMRKTHLEVERFPAIVFQSTSVKVGPEKAIVEGVLSLHGVDRTLMVPATIRYDSGVLTAEGRADLTYTDFGIAIPRVLWLVMEDAIQVRFRIVAGKAAP
jgi:polyisoprenoid-binding protein YceI